jgi:ribonuclease III
MPSTIVKLEQILGYKFRSPQLLERALTHRSWAYENQPDGDEKEIRAGQNESLEFVGDSVLGLVVAEQLFKRNPDMSEGELTLMKHHLVSMGTLAKVAKKLNLGKFMRIGRGEEKTGGRQKPALLSDTFEAIVAAIFFDSGYVQARLFINRVFAEEFTAATPNSSLDYKTLLQETLQSEKRSAPVYKVIKTEGLPHNRTFFVEAAWEGGRVSGKGASIKSAEMKAASLALKKLEREKLKASKT